MSMEVAAGFALILTVEVAMSILQVNKLRPNEVEELIKMRRNMVWNLGRRHTRSQDKDNFRAVAANGMEEGRDTLVCDPGS